MDDAAPVGRERRGNILVGWIDEADPDPGTAAALALREAMKVPIAGHEHERALAGELPDGVVMGPGAEARTHVKGSREVAIDERQDRLGEVLVEEQSRQAAGSRGSSASIAA